MLFCVLVHNSMPWKRGAASSSFKSGLVGDKMPSLGKVSLSTFFLAAALMLWLYVAALHTKMPTEAKSSFWSAAQALLFFYSGTE